MVVEFSKEFLKELKKNLSKSEAKTTIKKLAKTSPSEGDFIALIANIVIREKKLKTFRFYFIIQNNQKQIITKQELKELIIKFVALSKKNNQQKVIDKLKEDLKQVGFRI
jgi:hypothetical protein